MKPQSIRQKVFRSFFVILAALSICVFMLGFYIIKTDIIKRAQQQVNHDLISARSVYKSEIDSIKTFFEIVTFDENLYQLKEQLGLDYLYIINAADISSHKSEIVRQAFKEKTSRGARIIGFEELKRMGDDCLNKATMEILSTPKAKATTRKVLNEAMAIECARAIYNDEGKVVEVAYGGKIINRDFALIDRISNLVFEDELYDGKPIGTVTIFQGDVRIATNVLDENGERAIGTKVSETVYNQVIEKGLPWPDRAFVVTDWYMSAYEPIRNINGEIIGILYVGTLEKPFTHMIFKAVFAFLAIGIIAISLGGIISYFLAASIARPIENMLGATEKISNGQFGVQAERYTSLTELKKLVDSFNEMTAKLDERDENLKITNDKLVESNKSYVDLIGFVAHELKGLLSSAIMNSYSLRDGYLGMINFKQQRAIDSITRNLDYLTATVKKFLNLSRVEKGEMDINRTDINLCKDIFEVSIETFIQQFQRKNIKVTNNIDRELVVSADAEMMMIVANNLVSNAAKYGNKDGKVEMSSSVDEEKVTIEVYNDGRPITEDAMDKLFKKFSRLDVPEKKTVKGTGLGLFITKEIIEAHGGTINVIPRENGNSFVFSLLTQKADDKTEN
ncbi:MAG: cache domain-containing protein [Phycisphaerae bacterium]|nr:cache domain-containing protein [Phycisphaerae bacterium]